MQGHDIMVIGASSGGVDALTKLLRDVPAELPAAVFVAVHFSPDLHLPQILARAGSLPCDQAVHGSRIEHGRVIVSVPNRHLMLERGRVKVIIGPLENRHRPSIDALFRSAAHAYGPRVVGVMLSGDLNDGAAGLLEIAGCGGRCLVLDPREALLSDVFASTIAALGPAVEALPVRELARTMVRLAHSEVKGDATFEPRCGRPNGGFEDEPDATAAQTHEQLPEAATHQSRTFTCPDCHGRLREVGGGGDPLRFRCRLGHSFTAEALAESQDDAIERALWLALEGLLERSELAGCMADRAARVGRDDASRAAREKQAIAREHAQKLRDALQRVV